MIRILIEYVLLFLAPTLVYLAYIYLTRPEPGGSVKMLDDAPLIWLFIAGAVLILGALAYVSTTTQGGRPNLGYQPAIIKDGRIEPGQLK
jgi:hypothetical protein